MKTILCFFTLLLCFNASAQELPKNSQTFVRVYDFDGNKIDKGTIFKITDSEIILKKGKKTHAIHASSISYIKTKRTTGHNVLISASGGLLYGLFRLTQSNGSSLDRAGFAILTPIFIAVGSGVGYLTTLFKKSKQYSFTGDLVKWKAFKEEMYAPQN
uniref:hypothetical protein n=1 Tax=Polaribacter sp. TaxID=1920175 RepID=UPI0040470ADC